METNFNSLINEYRIKEFKKKINNQDFKLYTLTAIAYECGFNSKSTFNRVFKLECGQTPSEYVKFKTK
jgi:AraC-like DNA-binding protein